MEPEPISFNTCGESIKAKISDRLRQRGASLHKKAAPTSVVNAKHTAFLEVKEALPDSREALGQIGRQPHPEAGAAAAGVCILRPRETHFQSDAAEARLHKKAAPTSFDNAKLAACLMMKEAFRIVS